MRAKEKGQGLVEFALILPALLMILLGIIEGARLIWAYITIQNAAREAARYAITGQPYVNGEPWALPPCGFNDADLCPEYPGIGGAAAGEQCTDVITCNDRVDWIIKMAERRTEDLAPKIYGYTSSDFESLMGTPEALGVMVRGQRNIQDLDGTEYHAGSEGFNVMVRVYYNWVPIDPLYEALLNAMPSMGGTVHLEGMVIMQNEGTDPLMGPNPPDAGELANTGAASGGGVPPASSAPALRVYDVSTNETISSAPANTDIRIYGENHTPGVAYYLYLGSIQLTCTGDPPSYSPSHQFDRICHIPIDAPVGDTVIYSYAADNLTLPVAETNFTVERLGQAALNVKDGNTWPPGTPITIQMIAHDVGIQYNLHFNGNPVPINATPITIVDPLSQDYVWTIPADTAMRMPPDAPYYIESLRADGQPFDVTNTGIWVTVPVIKVQGGNTWPRGATINISIQGHAPNRTYDIRFDGITIGTLTTNADGNSILPLQYTIASTGSDSPPTFPLTSHDSGNEIARTEITLSTPTNPYITVAGGYEWPAGSLIDIKVHKHDPTYEYHLYFEDTLIKSSFSPSPQGEWAMQYVIPLTSTPASTYTIKTERTTDSSVIATREMTVTDRPEIDVLEATLGGTPEYNLVIPDSIITIVLSRHAANAGYSIYLDNNLIADVTTDDNGSYTYELNLSLYPTLLGGPFELESRQGDTVVARLTPALKIVAADLKIEDIAWPADARLETPFPMTITVKNEADVAVPTYFDVDLYISPEHEPELTTSFPPGDFKKWVQYVPPQGTYVFTKEVTLYGESEQAIYARADTTGYIKETNELNNMRDEIITIGGCEAEITDNFDDASSLADWSYVNYGNASGSIAPTVSGGALSLYNDGSTNYVTNDSSGGYQLVYREATGNFDVRVRVMSSDFSGRDGWAKAGLEVRDDAGSTTVNKVYIGRSKDYGITTRTRLSGSLRGAQYNPPTTYLLSEVYEELPVWLRIVRQSNTFYFYYSTSNATDPLDEDIVWTSFGYDTIPMSDPVHVGVFNTPYHSSIKRESTFDGFYMCVKSDSRCGTVQEQDGLVVIDAVNYVQSVVGEGSWEWEKVGATSGDMGMRVSNSSPYNSYSGSSGGSESSVVGLAPMLEYEAVFKTTGRWYIWLYAIGPSGNDDSAHVGFDGTLPTTSDRMYGMTSSAPPAWTNNTIDGCCSYIDITTAGVHTINLWQREDGTEIYKILLTTNPDYTPEGNIEQSKCLGSQSQEETYPPGLKVCLSDTGFSLGNPGFETTGAMDTYWERGSGFWYSPDRAKAGQRSGELATYDFWYQNPWVLQPFNMLDWVLTPTVNTTGEVRLYVYPDWGMSGGMPDKADPNDRLKVALRTTGVTPTLVTTATILATGSDTQAWTPKTADLAQAFLDGGTNMRNYAGQSLQLYFYADDNDLTYCDANPTDRDRCYNSRFYIDEIEIDFCTTQPVPAQDTDLATFGGPVRVLIGGVPTKKSGVRVWTYTLSGDLLTTYTLHDSTYHFYNVPPGTYIIYAELWDGAYRYSANNTITISKGQVFSNVSLLLM